jgi:hypothetical protein
MKGICSLPVFMLLYCLQQSTLAQTCYLQEKVTTRSDNSVSKNFYTYDDATHLLTEYKYPYSGDEFITEKFSYYEGTLNSVFEGMYTHSYFTDKKGRIEGVIDADDLGVSNFYQTFIYDTKGRLAKHTFFETHYMEDTSVASFTVFYYEGDKMVKMEEFASHRESDSQPTSTILYEYSTLKNPEYNPLYFPANTEKYVVTKLIYKEADGVPYDDYCYTRECTSNKEGYPVKCTLKYLDGTLKEVEDYTYRCK